MATILTIASLALTAVGTIAQASAEKEAAEYKAMMEERRGNEERAAGTRRAAERRKELAHHQSRLQAVAAASGGSASDPGTISLASQLEGAGEYNALMEVYTGESRARNWEMQAGLTRYEGRQKSLGTILGGASGILGRTAKFIQDTAAAGAKYG